MAMAHVKSRQHRAGLDCLELCLNCRAIAREASLTSKHSRADKTCSAAGLSGDHLLGVNGYPFWMFSLRCAVKWRLTRTWLRWGPLHHLHLAVRQQTSELTRTNPWEVEDSGRKKGKSKIGS